MVQVPIIQDSLLESAEQFSANLALVDNKGISVTVDPALTIVNIILLMEQVSREFEERGQNRGTSNTNKNILTEAFIIKQQN